MFNMIIKFDMFNEGLRDMMTPKSGDDLIVAVLNKINKNKKHGYFNPSDWGLKVLDYDGSGGMNDHHYITFKSQNGRRWALLIKERDYFPIGIREMKRGVTYYITDNFNEVEDYLRKKGLEKKDDED